MKDNIKKIFAVIAVVSVIVTLFSACGDKKETTNSTGPNIVPKEQVTEKETEKTDAGTDAEVTQEENSVVPEKKYDVLLDERDEDAKYQYDMNDLSLVDTVSGKIISVGMSINDIEQITGTAMTVNQQHRIYNGIIILYGEDDTAESLIVSSGLFPDENQATRFKSSRGVALGSTFEDFVKAYGDQFNEGKTTDAKEGEAPYETPANAIRYFRVDGRKVEFIGTKLDAETKAGDTNNIYMQDFMFSKDTNKVTTMRISKLDAVGR